MSTAPAAQIVDIDAELRRAHQIKANNANLITRHLGEIEALLRNNDELDRCVDGLLSCRASAQARMT